MHIRSSLDEQFAAGQPATCWEQTAPRENNVPVDGPLQSLRNRPLAGKPCKGFQRAGEVGAYDGLFGRATCVNSNPPSCRQSLQHLQPVSGLCTWTITCTPSTANIFCTCVRLAHIACACRKEQIFFPWLRCSHTRTPVRHETPHICNACVTLFEGRGPYTG